ncbi:MAG: hypothetical protein V3T99_03625 [Nitrososphaerales archaeon]
MMTSFEMKLNKDELATHERQFKSTLFPVEWEIAEKLFFVAVDGFRAFEANKSSEWRSKRHWTNMVKRCLTEIGRDNGYLIYPQEKGNRFVGQWLFDLVWIDAKAASDPDEFDWRTARGLKLACESEWTASETAIMGDFLKLTFAIADLRLFIYTNREVRSDGGDRVHPVDLCRRACPLSRGFRYLLLGFPQTGKDYFRVDAWTA